MATQDAAFSGSVPDNYDGYLVPIIFETYADLVASHFAKAPPKNLLEIAAGTGVVTRRLATALPASMRIVATDLNPAMIERARKVGTSRSVEWQPADAQALPFEAGSFDAITCQFGVMFFPERVKAFSEARRVLVKGGEYVFHVWDSLATNGFASFVTDELAKHFPSDPPRFFARTPYGHSDTAVLARQLGEAGFMDPRFETLPATSRAPSADAVVRAFILGTPLGGEVAARTKDVAAVVESVRAAIAARFGSGAIEAPMCAKACSVRA